MWCRKNNYVWTYVQLPEVVFKGGCVLKPIKQFYKCRVFTLDFSSLYPSLIQENRLCYASLLLPHQLELYLNRQDLEIKPINIGEPSNQTYHWVQNRRTCLPEILNYLVTQRGIVKDLLEACTDPDMKQVYNQRQNNYKLCGNSMYGFTGYSKSHSPCVAIAVCTTVRNSVAYNFKKC